MPKPNHRHDVEHFEHWSSTYEDSWMQRAFFDPAHRDVLALAASVANRPEAILDVGCGTGKLLRKAGARWPEAQLIGVDPATGMIEAAKRLTPNATFYVGSAEALPLEDASVDLAWSTLSFHHWQVQAAGVREVARILRPGGHFILVDMSFPGWIVHTVIRQPRVHDRAEMRDLFSQAGLQVQRQQRATWRGLLATVGEK